MEPWDEEVISAESRGKERTRPTVTDRWLREKILSGGSFQNHKTLYRRKALPTDGELTILLCDN